MTVLHLLKRYLGEYVHGLSLEALRVSVWKGDVVLKDLKLKAEALNSLKLPVTVKSGFIGTITLKVPWKSLGKEPVIVLIDRVFVLAYPAPDGRTLKEEDRERLFQDKLHQIEETEAATLEAMSRSGTHPSGNSWLGSLIATIIGNLKITISNVHIRYEDTVSNYGHPFACGFTLAKLAAVTMDEQGNETFDTSGALDKLRKSLQLERLAIYHDSDKPPWKIDENWQDLSPSKWIEIFEEGINEPMPKPKTVTSWASNRTYLVAPINGVLRYHRLGSRERNNPEIPFEKASLSLSDVSLTVTESQYYDWIKLLEVISRYRMHVEVLHLRPGVPVSDGPRLWWHYGVKAALQQRRMCFSFSWESIQHLCRLRRRYIHVYANFLQQLPNVDNEELRQIEMDLDSKVILLWRLLAHAKVESAKSKEAAVQKKLGKGSWFSFNWRSSPEDIAVSDGSNESDFTQEKLTKEEWQAVNNLLSYQPDEKLALYSGKDGQNMIQFLVDVSIGQAAAKIIDIHGTEVLCGRFEQLNVSTKFKHRSICCDLSLRFCGLSAPEGSLAQSVSSEQKENALVASFVRSPGGEEVDWKLSAAMCPCHVTILMESYERFMEFLKRSNAVSPTVAMETATALQMKFEKVTRKAQEQFQMVLEEQSRFALDVDFDAPKVRVPVRKQGSSIIDSHFLLDFGHFTLRTKEGQHVEDQSVYSRFYISVRDIAAFFTDCGSESNDCSSFATPRDCHLSGSPAECIDNITSLVDRCGMAVIVDQIKVAHPSFPSTRISVQVPNLGIHFSPARYCRLMGLLNMFYSTFQSSGQPVDEVFNSELPPWKPADIAADARILVWKGIGNSVAAWQPSYVALSGFHLYVLESERAPSYQRCTSMAGKQVFEVPPASVGGSLFSIAVCFRGMDIRKALESSSTLIIEFQNENDKHTWIKGLVKATYQASAPLSDGLLGETSYSVGSTVDEQIANSKAADLVINGTLAETNLYIYCKCGKEGQEKREETLIVELIAGGGKVHVIRSERNLTVKMKLHSLRIKDELRGDSATNPHYLAYSVVKNDQILSPTSVGLQATQSFPLPAEEEDIFRDALPEFTPTSDISLQSHSLEYLEAHPETLFSNQDLGRGKGSSSEIFYEALGSDNSDFVSVAFMTKDPSSPEYEGIDTQMNICMSKLEFCCNRPTLVALIQFGLDISSEILKEVVKVQKWLLTTLKLQEDQKDTMRVMFL
ncbi:putative vacuolar protein sorting-associated protein 13A [Bienertia sinuspersici]